jgi:hypothetical protein
MRYILEGQESILTAVDVNGTQLHYVETRQKNKKQSVAYTHVPPSDYRVLQLEIEPFSRHNRVISQSKWRSYPNVVEDDFQLTSENDGIFYCFIFNVYS